MKLLGLHNPGRINPHQTLKKEKKISTLNSLRSKYLPYVNNNKEINSRISNGVVKETVMYSVFPLSLQHRYVYINGILASDITENTHQTQSYFVNFHN